LAPKRPGPEGTFGKMVFSHALIHEIGGEDDTNRSSARKILGSYNEFVGMLTDDRQRKHLDKLQESEADGDKTFQKARELSHDFRDGVLEFFFDEDSGMCDLTRIYGVF
jgi:hypothetical protein